MYTRVGFWRKMLSILSMSLSNPLIDSEHNLVRFGTKKCVESDLNVFSINFPCGFLVLLEVITPSFGELDFKLVQSLFSHFF